MKLSNSKTKKCLYFLKKVPRSFQPQLEKIKKSPPPPPPDPRNKKKSLYIRKWNFLALILKKNPGNGNPEKKSLLFQETETLKKLLIFPEKEPFSPTEGNFLHFRTRKSRKNLYISGNRTFSYFGKGIFRTLAYLEPWHIHNYDIFRTRGIFRTLPNIYDGTFCKNSDLAFPKKLSCILGNGKGAFQPYISLIFQGRTNKVPKTNKKSASKKFLFSLQQ